MINRQSCYSALFKLKNAGIDITPQLKMMESNRGVPRGVIEFLRNNSPQFQFYRHLQVHQKTLAKNLLDYEELDNLEKIIVGSSFVTRAMIAVKYNNLDESLLEDLNVAQVSHAVDLAVSSQDYSELNDVLKKHSDNLKLFYLNIKQ